MGAYLPLLSINVQHTYFADGRCRGLRFVPSPDSAVLVSKLGLLLRASDNGIVVFYDAEHLDRLKHYAADQHEPLRLAWRVFSTDQKFKNYTGIATPDDKYVLLCDNRTIWAAPQGGIYLHRGAFAAVEDYRSLAAEPLQALLPPKDQQVPPCFVVLIDALDERAGLFDQSLNITPRAFSVHFKARQSYWRYYFIGALGSYRPFVVDVEQQVVFLASHEVLLPDGRKVWSARSTTPLALRNYSGYHLQLKTTANGGGKVLLKRLPVASASRLSKEMIAGRNVYVSEIFVNF